MARGITETDVWTASDSLLLEGARPTIERVRQKIGRGSPNTVSPYLDSWFKNLGGRIKDPGAFSAPQGVPDPVAQAATHLWEIAQTESRRDLDRGLKAGMAAAVANVEAEKERAALAESAAFEAVSKAAHLQAELAASTERHDREKLARADLQARLEELAGQLQQAQSQLQSVRLSLADRDERLAECSRQLEAANARAETAAKRRESVGSAISADVNNAR